MPITIEDIRNGIAESPELKETLLSEYEADAIDFVKGKGFQVYSAADAEKEFGKRINTRTGELYRGVEKDVLDTFAKYGITKEDPDEKIYDLIKKIPGKLDAKITDLEAKLADAMSGKGGEVEKATITALTQQLKDAIDKTDQLQNDFTAKEIAYKASQQIDKAFAELNIVVPASVSDKDKSEYITSKQAQLTQLLQGKYKLEEKDGQIVFTDSEGAIQMNGANVATAKDLLSANFKYDFDAIQKAGSGSKGGELKTPIIVKSKSDTYAQAAKEGMTAGSKEWLARVNELAKSNGISLAD